MRLHPVRSVVLAQPIISAKWYAISHGNDLTRLPEPAWVPATIPSTYLLCCLGILSWASSYNKA